MISKHTAVLSSLALGQQATIQNQDTGWKLVVVLDKAGVNLSVLCSQATSTGKELRGNASQIRQVPKAYTNK